MPHAEIPKEYEQVLRPTGNEPWLMSLREPEPVVPKAQRKQIKDEIFKHVLPLLGTPLSVDEEVFVFEQELENQIKIQTWLDFGGRFHSLTYSHSLVGEPHLPSVPISFETWLGISSQTMWSYILIPELESTALAIKNMIARFMNGFPRFLN
jgi:hypothetical protein